jgi:predicted CoA-binding protein
MKTLVIGASENPERYSYKAIHQLVKAAHEVKAVGLKKGNVAGIVIETGKPVFENIDTVTLYVGPNNQSIFYDYILLLKPRRVIFNPGTENPELFNLLRENKVEVEIACTLVLLATNSY